MPHRTRALIYIPDYADIDTHLRACMALADHHQWRPDEIVRDWGTLLYQVAEQPGVVIAATEAHLPRPLLPRLVVADRWQPPPDPGGRRATRLR